MLFVPHTDRAFGLKAFPMADTLQKCKDYVMTGFLESVGPIRSSREVAQPAHATT